VLLSTATSAGPTQHPRVLVPIANGSEEIEAVTIIDVLVRAACKVTVASVSQDLQVECSRMVKLVADCPISECVDKQWDAVVLPGGMPGATHLYESEHLKTILKEQVRCGIRAVVPTMNSYIVSSSNMFMLRHHFERIVSSPSCMFVHPVHTAMVLHALLSHVGHQS
jgi:DJ-1/PfpI family